MSKIPADRCQNQFAFVELTWNDPHLIDMFLILKCAMQVQKEIFPSVSAFSNFIFNKIHCKSFDQIQNWTKLSYMKSKYSPELLTLLI